MKGFAIALGLLCGCRQVLGFDDVVASFPDATAIDAAGLDGPADGSAPGRCAGVTMSGQRVCVDSTHAASCDFDVGSGLFEIVTIDRECPPDSTCFDGHCATPNNAPACNKPADCPSNTCDLFVVGGTIQGFCAMPFPGGTGPYSSCTAPSGNNTGCATGMCSLDGEDPNQRECLFAPCASDIDCPNAGSCHLLGQPTTLEGVSFPAGFKACFG